MGLSVSHGAWSGPYGSFGRFREAVALAAGIPLPFMEGFHGDVVEMIDAPYSRLGRVIAGFLPIKWNSLAIDALHSLLNHSDCDGEIAVSELLPLAVRLEEVAGKLSNPHADDARGFAQACREAHALGQPLLFS